jgi:hypothetical protein
LNAQIVSSHVHLAALKARVTTLVNTLDNRLSSGPSSAAIELLLQEKEQDTQAIIAHAKETLLAGETVNKMSLQNSGLY